ncbi:MAG: hypothetical protein FWG50_03560 [Kiritimatiellaeota bacterium]|nr:hypothetical protein [Kiritimatiellota bacterium]
MKTYVYTCRNKDGTLKRGQLEAPDRADALRQLRSQGHLPLSLSEGSSAARPQTKTHLAALAATAVLLAALAVVLSARHTAKTAQNPDTQKSRDAIAANRSPSPKNTSPHTPTQAAEPEDPKNVYSEPAPPPAHVAGAALQAEGDAEIPVAEAEAPDSTLRTQTEKMLSLMASLPPGAEIPPMPILPGMEKDFAAALTNEIVIHADDTDEMANRKEAIAWLKLGVATLVQEGNSPSEAIKLIEENANKIAKMRNELLRYATALYREGKEDEAMAFIAEANKELDPYGAEPIQLSPRLTRAKDAN